MSCLGILSREGGISGTRIWRVMFACGFGVFPWQDILAGLLGRSVWRVKLAHLFIYIYHLPNSGAKDSRQDQGGGRGDLRFDISH